MRDSQARARCVRKRCDMSRSVSAHALSALRFAPTASAPSSTRSAVIAGLRSARQRSYATEAEPKGKGKQPESAPAERKSDDGASLPA